MDAATLPAPPRAASLLDRVFDVYFRHPLPLLLFSAIYAVTMFALQSWAAEPAGTGSLRHVVVLVVNYLVSFAGMFAVTRVVRHEANGERVDLAQLFTATLVDLPRVIAVLVLYLLATFAWTLLLVVPGLVFGVSAFFAINLVAVTPLNGWSAIRHSRQLVRGRWWRTFLYLLLLILPYLLLMTFFQYLPKTAGIYWLNAALATVLYPIWFVGQAVLYFDLEARHQGDEREKARRVLAMTPPPAAAPVYAAPSHASFDAGAFSAFEHRGWQRAAGAYRKGIAPLTRQAADPLLDAAEVGPGAALLDVACGPGEIAGLAAARGATVTGVDFSPEMLAVARENHPGIEFRVADAEALPFSNGAFDAVTMGFLLGHLSHPERAIAEARRVLKPHRRFALAWWQPFDRAVAFGIVMDAVRAHGRTQVDLPPGPPFDQFSEPESLARALEVAGFSDVRLSPQPMTWRVESGEEVFDAFLHGTVRTAGLLREQSPEQLLEIRAEVVRRVEEYRGAMGVELPMPCWVASGVRPG